MTIPTIPDSVWVHPQVVASIFQATGTVVGAIIVGFVGSFLARWFSRARDQQDRESQWRTHAVELTKLDVQRKLAPLKIGQDRPRPAILDFLANYRDLQELGSKSPRELYEAILGTRIATPAPSTAALTNPDMLSPAARPTSDTT